MTDTPNSESPLFEAKSFDDPSVFTPQSLVENARQQKELPEQSVPEVCILDPDGDVVRQLVRSKYARKDSSWPGYHTDLYRFRRNGEEFGIVGCAVGAPFAVLVAEQLFASGCQFLVSVTSSGQIIPKDDPPYFVLIEQALRDEGTSHHLPASKAVCHARFWPSRSCGEGVSVGFSSSLRWGDVDDGCTVSGDKDRNRACSIRGNPCR